MSLQPLDSTPDIPEAYNLALSESRRWLVLAYSSRSTLCLRAQGIGLPDLRRQLEHEEEVLFGFLRFRRRGIVLQYTNPDCSRVVKARAQVHLQTILNFFRENDFLLETSNPKDITLDNIARLTNSASTSTINSGKRSKRLTDIMEESPYFDDSEESNTQDGQSSPSSEASTNAADDAATTTSTTTTPVTAHPPKELVSSYVPKSKDGGGGHSLQVETPLISASTTPKSSKRTPSPQRPQETDFPCDSLDNPTSPSNALTNDFPTSPPPTPSPPVPTPPLPPEKIRLLKALEIRRQKLEGKSTAKTPVKTICEEKKRSSPPPLPKTPPSPEHRARVLEARRLISEEHRKNILGLEKQGKDLLSGWINFQTSTSLLWRRKFIRITSGKELILSEIEDFTECDKLWRWKVNADIKSIEVPEQDEEQLPHSLRINVERGGAVCVIACQTGEDLTNLRRVLGYCLNDDVAVG